MIFYWKVILYAHQGLICSVLREGIDDFSSPTQSWPKLPRRSLDQKPLCEVSLLKVQWLSLARLLLSSGAIPAVWTFSWCEFEKILLCPFYAIGVDLQSLPSSSFHRNTSNTAYQSRRLSGFIDLIEITVFGFYCMLNFRHSNTWERGHINGCLHSAKSRIDDLQVDISKSIYMCVT